MVYRGARTETEDHFVCTQRKQDYPDAVVMALELAGSEAAEARVRVVIRHKDKEGE